MNKKFVYKELTKQIFKSVGWLAFLFQAVLLFIVVQPIFSKFMDSKQFSDYGEITTLSLFDYYLNEQIAILVVTPIILGMFLFHFIMRRSSSDFIHGLPISKKAVYFHHVLSGVVMLIVPIILTALFSWLFVHAEGFSADAAANLQCMEWILFASGIALLSFSLATVAAMVSGNFKVQGIISIGILAMLFIFPYGLEDILSRFVYGFGLSSIELRGPGLSLAVIAVAMFILWLMSKVYRKRKVENISEPIVFKGFKPVFKILFTLLAMFGSATITVYTAEARPTFVIMLLLGALVGYIFALVILKEVKVSWKNYRAYIGYCTVLLVGLLGMYFYAPTYNYAIPEVSEISEVTIESIYTEHSGFDPQLVSEILEVCTLSEPTSIETVTEVHEQLVDQKEVGHPSEGDDFVGVSITYKLENGRDVSRTYYHADKETYESFYAEVTNLPEFRENICVFLDTVVRENTDEVSWSSFEVTLSSSDTEMFNSLIDALIEDAKIVSELVGNSSDRDEKSYYQVMFSSNLSGGHSIWITSEYVNTIQWLEDNGYEEEAALLKGEVAP